MVREFVFTRVLPALGRAYAHHVQPVAAVLELDRPLRVAYDRVATAVLPSTITLTIDGVATSFRVSNRFEYSHFTGYRSQPDYAVLCDLLDHLDPGDVFWDVGANVGIYTAFAATEAGAVVAIEPHPKNAARLRENLALNGREAEVRRVALSTTTGTTRLALNSPDVTGAFGSTADLGTDRTIEVPQRRGDELVADTPGRPTVLKVDVQGSEASVLQGLARALDACRHVYCNVYEKHHDTPDERWAVREGLQARGFDVRRIQQWSGGHFLRADAP